MEAVKTYGPALEYASSEIRSDKHVVKRASKTYMSSFEYSAEELKSDRKFVLDIIFYSSSHILFFVSGFKEG